MEGHIRCPAALRISKAVALIGVTGPEEEEEHEEEEEGEEGGGAERLRSTDWALLGRVGPTEGMLLPPRPITGDAYLFTTQFEFNLGELCGAVEATGLYLEATSRAAALRVVGPIAALLLSDGSRGGLVMCSDFAILCRNAADGESLAGESIAGIVTHLLDLLKLEKNRNSN